MEMQRDAKWIIRLLNVRNLNFDKLKIQLEKEVAEGKINPFKLEERMPNWCCSMTRFYFEEGL